MSDKLRKYEGGGVFMPSLFNRFFDDDFFSRAETNLPAVNVKENKKEFKLEVSAPGFEKGDFHVQVDKNVLTISAQKEMTSEEKGEDEKILRQEFSCSTFTRSFTLPEHIDTDNITAKGKNGILMLHLPKLAEAKENKVKQIEIK